MNGDNICMALLYMQQEISKIINFVGNIYKYPYKLLIGNNLQSMALQLLRKYNSNHAYGWQDIQGVVVLQQ